jgi:hypothetical protein
MDIEPDVAAITQVVRSGMLRMRRPKAVQRNGRKHLTPTIGLTATAVVSWVMGLFFAALGVLLVIVVKPPYERWHYMILWMFPPLAALLLLAPLAIFRRISFDADAIYCSWPWSAERKVRWDDVLEYRPNSVIDLPVIRTKDNRRLRLDEMRHGFPELLDELKNRKVPELKKLIL